MSTFKHLFSPFTLGHATLRNRIVSTPHNTHFGSDGYVTQRYIDYYAEKAKGGAGLLQCFGSLGVHPTAPVMDWGGIKNWDDSSLPMFQRFAETMHAHGAVVMAQITHRGRRGSSAESETPLLSSSDIPERLHHEIPHALDVETIEDIVRSFADGALRLKRAGFDGADLCGFARHLIDQFWIPSVNRRTDQYGGSFENRMRFSVEIIQAIRAAVGRDFILGIRVSGDEMLEDGLTLDDAIEIARYLNALGLLDYFTVTGASGETAKIGQRIMPFADQPQGVYAHLAAAIREVVDVPIIYAGRVTDPRHAERLLEDGVCDLVAMTRALIADPWMPQKAEAGHLDDIRVCLGMQEGCLGRNSRGLYLSCTQNPVTGREAELAEIVPAAVPKKVVVVGGGPAGLEAARVAALRGHQVVLFERGPRLGGQVLIAANAPLRPAWGESVEWLSRQIAKTSAEVRLNTAATEALILAERPDAVIIATGAVPRRPEIPGVDLVGVGTVEDVLSGTLQPGQRCVVVDATGQAQAGLAADFLARQGKAVTLVTPYHTVCDTLEPSTKEPLLEKLYQGGVVLMPDTNLKSIELSSVERTASVDRLRVRLENEYSGRDVSIDGVDTVVLAWGGRAVDDLHRALKGKVPQLELVGDALAPRRMHDAMLEGTRAARRI